VNFLLLTISAIRENKDNESIIPIYGGKWNTIFEIGTSSNKINPMDNINAALGALSFETVALISPFKIGKKDTILSGTRIQAKAGKKVFVTRGMALTFPAIHNIVVVMSPRREQTMPHKTRIKRLSIVSS
jgi:hypothetical protein